MPYGAGVTEPEVKSVSYLDPRGHVHTVDRQLSGRLGDVRGAVAALLDMRRVNKMVQDHRAGLADHSWGLWAIWMLARWDQASRQPDKSGEVAVAAS